MNLFSALSVNSSGMSAQRTRAEVLVENLANSDTTRTSDGGPYRRRDVVFESQAVSTSFASVYGSQIGEEATGVGISEITVDSRDPERRYMPGHPDADQDGYVSFPRVNPAEDMVDLMSASRGYEANVSAISAIKDMILHSIDLMK